jgi:1-deoxy-D-xylulose-5-phosphate synthase
MAIAAKAEQKHRKVVAVIGDGAITAGMAFEALNHAGEVKPDMLVILNDNEMSISPNVGAIPRYLNRMRLSAPVKFITNNLEGQIRNIPFVGEQISPEIERIKDNLKIVTMVPNKIGAVFEELGFTYIGPVDGHNIRDLIATFKMAHTLTGPVMVHVATTKGKGYSYAEADRVGYHAQNSFDLSTGKAKTSSSSKPKPPSYSKVFADTLIKLAEHEIHTIVY